MDSLGSESSCNGQRIADALRQERRAESTALEHYSEAVQYVTSFDFIWTIEGFSLLPKLGRHFSDTFDAKGLKWGFFLEPWNYWGSIKHPSLTLYLVEDGACDLEESGDLTVSYRVTMFNQGCGEDKQYRGTVFGVFARRLERKWEGLELPSYSIFLDPSFGFLVDDTCAFGVQIMDVSPTVLHGTGRRRQATPACSDGPSGNFRQSSERNIAFINGSLLAATTGLAGRSQPLGSEGLHIYIGLSSSHFFSQLFGRFTIRLISQITGKHVEKSFCSIFHAGRLHGCAGVVPLRTFLDEQERFLIKDRCIVEVEVTVLSQRPRQEVWNFYRGAYSGNGETNLMTGHHYASEEENTYHNPFEWDMSPYWSIIEKDPDLDIANLVLNHTYTSLDGYPLH